MTANEKAYTQGYNVAVAGILQHAASLLGYQCDATTVARLAFERVRVVAKLREVCADHGDNDWPDDLDLCDVIEKHLRRHLADPKRCFLCRADLCEERDSTDASSFGPLSSD